MARKRDLPAAGATEPVKQAAPGLPAEVERNDWTVVILALMLFLAPSLGVPNEEMLQDTLKSIIVSFSALVAALLLFLNLRQRAEPLRWHAVLWLPLGLMAYALGSMAWSHTYLAAVETIRWFVFALLLWLGLNTLTAARAITLAWSIHAGAVVAALWAALQFWFGFDFFPQGPNPASTFINRNFFAEFVVCTLPFAALLLARARQSATVALLAFSTGFLVLSILMTGTRAALLALWIQLLVVIPLAAWRWRQQLACARWSRGTQAVAVGVMVLTVLGLGLIPTGNRKIIDEQHGMTPLERAVTRTKSIQPGDSSLNLRMIMWRATTRVIESRPVTGVGAGAWESEIPLYQDTGAQLETDYYVHNEFLQLLAEYGAVGWAFLILLFSYLVAAAWRTWRLPGDAVDGPIRTVALTSVLALMVVSNVGFPWRMATTGALFALCLAMVAASDARQGIASRWAASRLPWRPGVATAAAAIAGACLLLGGYITERAAQAESKLVRAAKIAVTISNSGRPNDPRWNPSKREMLQLVREGIAINPHYRKITPIVADELARWGDWADAIWIWESVLKSRPHIVAIMGNVARGYEALGQTEKALQTLARAKQIQPRAPAVRSLEVILMARMGQASSALAIARQALQEGLYDYDMLNAGAVLAMNAGDTALAQRMIEVRAKEFPDTRIRGLMQLGELHARSDPARALEYYRAALRSVPAPQQAGMLAQIPPELRQQLQTSASSK